MIYLLFLIQTHVIQVFKEEKFLLYFDPLDIIELAVEKGYSCVFGGWDDDLELEVDVGNGRGRVITYGPYQSTDDVFGAAMTISDYVIRFSNNSPSKHTVAVRCQADLYTQRFKIYDGFPVEEYDTKYYKNISELTEPILYTNLKNSGTPISYSLFISLMIFLNIGSLLFACRYEDNPDNDAVDNDLDDLDIDEKLSDAGNAFFEALLEIFSFGGSAGSFLSNVVSLFRIFQRLSATSSFKTKFSTDAKSLFSWATDIIKIILDKLPSEHLSDFELFSVYSYGYSIFIIFYIILLLVGLLKVVYIVPLALFCIAFGAGWGYIGISTGWACALIIVPPLIFSGITTGDNYIVSFHDKMNPFYEMFDIKALKGRADMTVSILQITAATVFSIFVFMCFISNVLTKLEGICDIVVSLFAIIIVVILIVNLIVYKLKKILVTINILIDGSITVLSLLLVPICETFVAVIESTIGPKWYIIFFFVVINLMFPIALKIALILSYHKSIRETYREGDFKWFEVADVSQKIAYAILAAYDIPWACFALQVVWMIVYCIIRPCDSVSDNVLNIGEAFVLIIVNGVVAVSAMINNKLFPFELCVAFIVLACLPVIIASYCFFCCDFKFGKSSIFDKINDTEATLAKAKEKALGINVEALQYLYILCLYGIPISCFIYGTNIPFIYGKVRVTI